MTMLTRSMSIPLPTKSVATRILDCPSLKPLYRVNLQIHTILNNQSIPLFDRHVSKQKDFHMVLGLEKYQCLQKEKIIQLSSSMIDLTLQPKTVTDEHGTAYGKEFCFEWFQIEHLPCQGRFPISFLQAKG